MRTDVHVLPTGDLLLHEETRACWCVPRVELQADDTGGAALVTHRAADCREELEAVEAEYTTEADARTVALHRRSHTS